MLSELRRTDIEIYEAIKSEVHRGHVQIEMIASENYVSAAVMEAQGSVLTNKYAEGYPGKRYYGGCEHVDVAESLAIKRAMKLFGAEHANVQPHSGSQANMAVYQSVLDPGDMMMTMAFNHGGHLSHGHPKNYSSTAYNIVHYGVSKEDERIDYNEAADVAMKNKPKLIVVGASSYPREIDFNKFKEIADSVGAYLMADIAHIAGPVAAGLHCDPIPICDFVTTTTHKTLRGPRGGVILCKEKHKKRLDASIFPGMQGGPLMHVIAGKAVAFKEALSPGFKLYQKQILANARTLAKTLMEKGFRLVTAGTDNHLMVVDVTSFNVNGVQATSILDEVGITVNHNNIPFDTLPPTKSSGIRLGTPAITTRGMLEEDMQQLGNVIAAAMQEPANVNLKHRLREETLSLVDRFPVYSGIRRMLFEQHRSAYDF